MSASVRGCVVSSGEWNWPLFLFISGLGDFYLFIFVLLFLGFQGEGGGEEYS